MLSLKNLLLFFFLWRAEPVPDEMNAIVLQLKHEQPGATESVSESKAQKPQGFSQIKHSKRKLLQQMGWSCSPAQKISDRNPVEFQKSKPIPFADEFELQ